MIARDGAGSVTYRAVAARAGVSLGVVTYHFPDRRALLAGAFALHLEQVRSRGARFELDTAAAWRAGDLDLDDLAEGLVAFLSRMAHDDRASVVAGHELSVELTRNPELTAEVDEALRSHRRATATLVARRGSDAPDEDAAIISAVMDQLLLQWLAHAGDARFEERLRRVVRRLVEKLF